MLTDATHSKLWGTATVTASWKQFQLTNDTEKVTGKKYYTFASATGYSVVAEPAANPKQAGYYEVGNTDATAAQKAGLKDYNVTITVTGGARTRVIASANAPADQSQANFSTAFSSAGVGSHVDLSMTISSGVITFTTTTVAYSVAGQITAQGADMNATSVRGAASWTDDGESGAIDGASLSVNAVATPNGWSL
ncbi:MAG: hypothetical protein K5694_06665 [Bacilli bacterium]|nr:hypothetical protein [Bacilli bacterium]